MALSLPLPYFKSNRFVKFKYIIKCGTYRKIGSREFICSEKTIPRSPISLSYFTA
jgi:hypothetical protein